MNTFYTVKIHKNRKCIKLEVEEECTILGLNQFSSICSLVKRKTTKTVILLIIWCR